MVEGLQFLADGAAGLLCACLDILAQLGGYLLCLVGVFLVGYPFVGKSPELGGAILVVYCFAKQLGYTLLHLLIAEGHTEAELAEVLK